MNRPLCRVVLIALFAGLWPAPGAASAPKQIASWTFPIKMADLLYTERLFADGGALTLEEHFGPMRGKPTSEMRRTLAFSAIGCVAGPNDDIKIYPAKRWSVESTDLRTGKASEDADIALSFPTARQGKAVLTALEALSPAFRSKVGACKNEVDLYHLQFGAIPPKTEPFTWVRNSMIGATPMAIWLQAATLYVEETYKDPSTTYYYKLPLTDVRCLAVDPATKYLAPSVDIHATHPAGVLAEAIEKGKKPRLSTLTTVSLSFDNDVVQQDAVQYLEDKSAVFAKKRGGC